MRTYSPYQTFGGKERITTTCSAYHQSQADMSSGWYTVARQDSGWTGSKLKSRSGQVEFIPLQTTLASSQGKMVAPVWLAAYSLALFSRTAPRLYPRPLLQIRFAKRRPAVLVLRLFVLRLLPQADSEPAGGQSTHDFDAPSGRFRRCI